MKQGRVNIPEELKEKRDAVMDELVELDKDPKLLEEDIEFHKKVSFLSPKDLLQRFTI